MSANDNGGSDLFGQKKKSAKNRRAAIYVRMSTEHQQYSTKNQGDAISVYAQANGFDMALLHESVRGTVTQS